MDSMDSMDSPGGLIVIDEGLFSSTGSTGYSQARANAEVSDESDRSTIDAGSPFWERIAVFQAYSPEMDSGVSGKRARSGQDEAIRLKKRRFSSAEKKEQTEQTGLSDKTYTPKLRAMAKTIAERVRVEGLGRDGCRDDETPRPWVDGAGTQVRQETAAHGQGEWMGVSRAEAALIEEEEREGRASLGGVQGRQRA